MWEVHCSILATFHLKMYVFIEIYMYIYDYTHTESIKCKAPLRAIPSHVPHITSFP